MRQIFENKDLYFIFGDDKPPTQDKPKKINHQKMQEAQKKEEKLHDQDYLIQSMEKLALSNVKSAEEIAVQIEERLMQVSGNLFCYDGDADMNHLLKSDCFLAIDRLGK